MYFNLSVFTVISISKDTQNVTLPHTEECEQHALLHLSVFLSAFKHRWYDHGGRLTSAKVVTYYSITGSDFDEA
jgi:hypothetical protein